MSLDLDLFHLPGGDSGNTVIYHNTTQKFGATTSYQTWVKPRQALLAFFVAIGGGGAGGAGQTGNSGTSRKGGGGGGGGNIVAWLVPAAMLPGEVYVYAGWGGIPGTNAGGGESGVTWDRDNPGDLWIVAPGGGGGVSGANGASGGSSTSMNASLGPLMRGLGIAPSFTVTGSSGSAGGTAGNPGGSIAAFAAGVCTHGGTGGGGVSASDTAGGGFTAGTAGWGPLVASVAGGTAGGGAGQDGFAVRLGYYLGGAGGGTNNTGTGGAGGNGSIGSGGGGGGAGTTGGAAGSGGPGLVIVTWA